MKPGTRFPDYELEDHTGAPRRQGAPVSSRHSMPSMLVAEILQALEAEEQNFEPDPLHGEE